MIVFFFLRNLHANINTISPLINATAFATVIFSFLGGRGDFLKINAMLVSCLEFNCKLKRMYNIQGLKGKN